MQISDDFHWMSGVAENGWVWDFLNAERGYAEAFHNRYDIDTEVYGVAFLCARARVRV